MGKENVVSKEEVVTHVDIPEAGNRSESPESDSGTPASTKPTLAELADSGFAPGEIEMAKKQGLVEGEPSGDNGKGGNDAAGKRENVQRTDGQTKDGDSVAKGEKEKEKGVNERFRILSKGRSPEQVMADVAEKGTLSPEQETVLLASLSQNGQALYWGQKKERLKRQKIEADSATERAAKDKEIADLKAIIAEKKKIDDLGLDEEVAEVDPKKKPLTVEDLEKIETEKTQKQTEAEKQQNERANEIREALESQEKLAKERYEDFDSNLEFTKKIIAANNAGELEKLYPDPRQLSRMRIKVVELLRAFANADSFEPGDFDAADMSYELAKEHPEFGKQLKNNVTKTDETGVDGDPEKAARIVANANRRGSSAILSGGSSRRVALDELNPDQALRIPTKDFNKLPKATRERLLGKR